MEFIEFLHTISSKPIVVGLAILGAVCVTFARLIGRFKNRIVKSSIGLPVHHFENRVVRLGYIIMAMSVTLFIIAGFVSDLV